ncbi:MAG: RHS repeat protein, partial [Bryobacterales bacterium]|nr:RHS repeat protein [Bryobacterales bacterium]
MPHSQRASAGRMACAVVLLAGLTVISPVALGQGGLDNGQNHTGAIAAAGQTVTWTFAANAGDAISLAIGEVTDTGSFWPWIRLLRPDGTQIGSGYGALTGHIDIAAAPLTGVYSVLVASGDSGRIGTGSYRLTLAKTPGAFVVPAGDEGGAMTNGENHAGAIHLGDLDMWTFQANAGDAITLSIGEVTDSGSFWPWIRLRSPTGAQIGSGYGALTGHIDVAAAPLTGTYTLVVASADSGSNGTGTYRLTLAKTPGNFVVPSGDEGGAMTNGANHTGAIHLGDLDQWTFQANAGDAISVSIGETADNGSFWPWIRLRAPNGAQLGSGYGALSGHINVAAAPQTGTYTVVVTSADSGSNGTGAYRLNMAKSPGTFVVPSGDEGGTMTNGANHTGAIQLADLDQWSFQANAGDAISVSVGETTDTGSFWPWIRLRAPNGAQLGSGYGALSGHINVASAPQTGTYTVVVASADSGSNGTGTYHLTLAKTPGAFVVPSGDQGGPLTVGPNNPGAIFLADLDQWTLQARAGDTIDLSISETADAGSFWPWIRLRGPTGIQYGSAYGASSAQIHIASAALTGTYTVVVASADSGSNGAGSYLLTSSHAGTSVTPPASDKSLGPDCVGNVACGNPINITSGNKYQEVTDYETAGANKLRFTRYYNSLSDLNGSPSILGKAWRSTFDRTLYFLSPTSLIAERETGRTLTFHLSAGKWTPDSDVDLKLTQSGSGAGSTWTLTDSGDTVETYHALTADSAVLTAIQARGGYTQTLTRDASGVLQTVTDSFGRSLQFAYQDGFLRTLTTPDTLSLTYGYTSPNGAPDRLTSVAYSTAPATSQTYLYENTSLPYALTGITDENGGRFATWTYDAAGRARLSQHNAGADRVLAAYNANGTRTVTNALGQQEIYTFSILQGVRKVIRINRLATPKTPAAVRTFTYDANGYLSSETDWKGRQTTYVNDARGLPLTITEAVGTPVERVTTIAYDPAFHVPTSIVEPGVTTEFTYDGAGNLLTRTLTDTTTTTIPYPTNGAKRVWTYTWGANGLLASVRGPRTALNQLKSFTYDGSGTLIQTTDALGHQIRVTQHTGGGLPLTIVDANGLTTELTYDDRLRLKTSTITLAGGPRTTTYDYDAVGNLTKVILPDGSFLSGTYDLAHRLTTVRDRLNQTVSYSLDLSGNRTQTVFRNSSSVVTRTKSAEYDALG